MRACILAVMTVCLPIGTAGFAQESPVQADKPAEFVRPKLPEIPDEPKTVDPATLVPEMLAQKVTVEFKNTSLREVATWVQENAKVTVVFDTEQFGQNGSLLDTITEKLDDDPLYLLFDRLSSLGLAWYVEDQLIYVTSLEVAESRMITKSYSLSDLIDDGYDPLNLSQAIQYTIPEGNWSDGSTPNDPEVGQQEWLADVLFVRQTAQIHRKIVGLFEALRKPSRMRFVYDPPEHEPLRAALEQNVSVEFEDTPLVEAIATLAQLTEADIRLDQAALRSVRIREREPISLILSDRKLSSVLRVLLSRLKLTWTIRDGVLWITTPREADRNYKIAVFLVRDLCQKDEEVEPLFQAIMNQTDGIWSDGTTPNDPDIGNIESVKTGVMIIRQTEPVLQQIDQLLTNYRAALLKSKIRKRAGEDPEEILTRYYRLHSVVANDLADVLPQLVEPKSWKSEQAPEAQGEILMKIASSPGLMKLGNPVQEKMGIPAAEVMGPLYSVLIIRQQRQIHEKIEKVIERVEQGDTRFRDQQGGQFGGGGGFGGGFFQLDPQLEQKLPLPKQDP